MSLRSSACSNPCPDVAQRHSLCEAAAEPEETAGDRGVTWIISSEARQAKRSSGIMKLRRFSAGKSSCSRSVALRPGRV
jgi:hypothetical protein